MVVTDRRQSPTGEASFNPQYVNNFSSSSSNLSSGRGKMSKMEVRVCNAGRPQNSLVIREGFSPPVIQDVVVEGKGKKVVTFWDLIDEDVQSYADQNQINHNLSVNFDRYENGDMVDNVSNRNVGMKEDFIASWKKPQLIKLAYKAEFKERLVDDIVVKLNVNLELANSQIFKNSIVVKVLGINIPFLVCSMDLRRQWSKYGNFHLITLWMDWILCSFKTSEAMEEVFSGDPWYIGWHIVGMNKWSPSFSTRSLNDLTASVEGSEHNKVHKSKGVISDRLQLVNTSVFCLANKYNTLDESNEDVAAAAPFDDRSKIDDYTILSINGMNREDASIPSESDSKPSYVIRQGLALIF
ncbi:hypothetical protein M5K25_024679 [Dendrobium thyrsiflorum]|uniref:DUF4283 domain-containing protein n=1 Tax=Dendrobium thyrsiflorum TaxID=117978 RepID=A0ABD0U2Z7_DENTH